MKLLTWRTVALVLLIFWLPINQVLVFYVSICSRQMGETGHMMPAASSAAADGTEDCSPAQPCGDTHGGACMIFAHCHFSGAWAFSPYGVPSQASFAPYVVLSTLSAVPQFDPDGLERPPRAVPPYLI